ncbi:hypothetical protein [Trichococcus shcherbakoviae]|uniref:hypothetical protein n=1 Tax=Trichococcus shcherbakoviae TaxID=2094020 RepID=UPI002AA6C10B|nr:hypothetical protein [Trichococcus shcherbakoviae]
MSKYGPQKPAIISEIRQKSAVAKTVGELGQCVSQLCAIVAGLQSKIAKITPKIGDDGKTFPENQGDH